MTPAKKKAAAKKATAKKAAAPVVEATEAPAGFVIKGSAGSKKYHVPGSTWYDQTVAEVWFETIESAKAAGYEPAGGESRQQFKDA